MKFINPSGAEVRIFSNISVNIIAANAMGLRRQAISRNDIGYAGWINPCFPWRSISTAYALAMPWNDMHI